MNETDILHAFIAETPYRLPHVRVFRRNVINVRTDDGRRVRNGIKGMADAYALVRGGLHVEIEAKSATGSLRPEQRRWRAFCAAHRIPYIVISAAPGEPSRATVERWVHELRTAIEAHESSHA